MLAKTKDQRTFGGDDKFEREEFAKQLTKVITRYTPLYEEAFVLSLNAPWGTGKTTFLDMWKNHLESQDEPYRVIHINAWETDFDEEPLIPIISALIENIDSGKGKKRLKAFFIGFLGAAALATNGVLSRATGINVDEIGGKIHDSLTSEDVQAAGESLYKEYSFKKSAYEALRAELQTYVESKSHPLVIFVDELDRVRPDYAVKFLEAIKHIFSAKGVCFVIAVDKVQLEQSVKQLYGDIDFSNYYRRFITREARLPDILTIDFKPFLELQFSPFYSSEDGDSLNVVPIKSEDKDAMIHVAMSVCKCCGFNPRQIKDWCRTLIHFIAIDTDDIVNIHKIYASMLLIAISMDEKKGELLRLIEEDGDYAIELSEYVQSLYYSWDPEKGVFQRMLMGLSMAFSLKKPYYDIRNSSNYSPAKIFSSYLNKTNFPKVDAYNSRNVTPEQDRQYALLDLQRTYLVNDQSEKEYSGFYYLQQRMKMWSDLVGEKDKS